MDISIYFLLRVYFLIFQSVNDNDSYTYSSSFAQKNDLDVMHQRIQTLKGTIISRTRDTRVNDTLEAGSRRIESQLK